MGAVDVSIKGSDGYWWNGTSQWTLGQVWVSPIGLELGIPLNINNLINGVSYEVISRATDITGNVQTIYGRDTLTYDVTNPNVGYVMMDWIHKTIKIGAVQQQRCPQTGLV